MFFLFYAQGDFGTIMGLRHFSYSYTVSDIHPLDGSLFINIRFSHVFNERCGTDGEGEENSVLSPPSTTYRILPA